MRNTAALDMGELARFMLTGVAAAVGNVGAVWLALFFVTFEIALLAGIVAGLTISFTLSKLFAFNSRSWGRAGGEAARFIIVYGVSCAAYWAIAVVIGRFGLAHGISPRMAEAGGILMGASSLIAPIDARRNIWVALHDGRISDRLGCLKVRVRSLPGL
jgi:putative flippase GtrA